MDVAGVRYTYYGALCFEEGISVRQDYQQVSSGRNLTIQGIQIWRGFRY